MRRRLWWAAFSRQMTINGLFMSKVTVRRERAATQVLYEEAWRLLAVKRGHNGLRGNSMRDPARWRIGLEREAQGDQPPGGTLWLHFGPTLSDCVFPLDNRLVSAADAGGLSAWLDVALHVARGRAAYIRTRDDRADYK